MIGQAKYFSSHQQKIDEYLKDHKPANMRTTIPFDLRGYISYVDKNHIIDPDEIPTEIMDSFFHPSEQVEKIPV